MIISASRRTDIPAFYSEWFVNRLEAGFVYVKNPLNSKQISKISLSPDEVDCIVFWTKNVQPMLDSNLGIIDEMGYSYYFQFTLTPYDRSVEKNLGDKQDILQGFKRLSERIGKQRVIWRYDPIIVNECFPVEYHLHSFDKLCYELCDYTTKCVFSYVDIYAKIGKLAKKFIGNEVAPDNINKIAQGFADIAKQNQIILETCSEEIDLSQYGIQHAACIDKKTIEFVTGCAINSKKDKNQRQACGCIESVDIGAYNSCSHGCIYCYATLNDRMVQNSRRCHDVHSPLLIGQPGINDKITDRLVKSLKSTQISLF
jgi:hypothetical protein